MDITAEDTQQHIALLKTDIRNLKNQLSLLNQKKEAAFRKKEEFKKQIFSEIQAFKTIRDEIFYSTKEKEDLKNQRNQLNSKFRELIKVAKEKHKEKKKLLTKHGFAINPSALKEKIEKLDTRIETEAMKFDDEKKIMKTINELKKKLHDADAIKSVFKEGAALSKDIDVTKEQADSFHHMLSQKRTGDKEKYGKLKEHSKKIKALKKEQQTAFDEFIAFKKEFMQKSDELQSKLKELTPMLQRQTQSKEQWRQRRIREEERTLAEKERAVEEKLRSRKKLTNEDLLVFQRK